MSSDSVEVQDAADWPDKADSLPAPETVNPTTNHSLWNLVSQEYGKFHKSTQTFIRWAILIAGVAFALSFASSKITSTVCHWTPARCIFAKIQRVIPGICRIIDYPVRTFPGMLP